jgi:hypothetical protein
MCIFVLQDSVHKLVSRSQRYVTWKIIYAVLPEIEKHFYKNIYMITLCNFWHRSCPWPNTQHIQKLATEVLWFLSYCRSRVFTFVFFMQKLKSISSGQNNKSCSTNHHGSSKIGFTFFWIFCDFLCNLQGSAIWIYYWSLPFAKRTLERFARLQLSPYGGCRRGPADFGEAGGARARGRGGGGLGDPLGPV